MILYLVFKELVLKGVVECFTKTIIEVIDDEKDRINYFGVALFGATNLT